MRKYRGHPGLTDEEIAVLGRVELELKLRGYARKTRKSYKGYCRRLLQWKRGYRGKGQSALLSTSNLNQSDFIPIAAAQDTRLFDYFLPTSGAPLD